MFIDLKTGKLLSKPTGELSQYYKAPLATPEMLGGKAFGIHWLSSKEWATVPKAFSLPTTLCSVYALETVKSAVKKSIPALTKAFIKELGYMPLVSVRSGAAVSCPGMMDTILNIGIDSSTAEYWAQFLGAQAFNTSGVRLISMFANVVKGVSLDKFKEVATYLEALNVYKQEIGADFPDATGQLVEAIEAVFNSWNNERAVTYRTLNSIPNDLGTAVTIQQMVFGNLNGRSCTGVVFSRNPDTGEAGCFGEFLVNAQGEDIVAGIRTPDPLAKMAAWDTTLAKQLTEVTNILEFECRDMQDVEFTIEDRKLYILQTRNAKRTSKAAIKVAFDLYAKNVISYDEAITRFSLRDIDKAQYPTIEPGYSEETLLGVGIPACTGIVTGVIVTTAQAAIACTEPCILVTEETTPEDIGGINAACAVLTMRGGSTSHAAVVARGMNKPCVVGFGKTLDDFLESAKEAPITLCGATGRVWYGVTKPTSSSADLIPTVLSLLKAGMPNIVLLSSYVDVVDLVISKPFDTRKEEPYLHIPIPTSEQLALASLIGFDLAKAVANYLILTYPIEVRPFTTVISAWDAIQVPEGFKTIVATASLEKAFQANESIAWMGENSKLAKRLVKFLECEGVKCVLYGSYSKDITSFISYNYLLTSVLS